MPSVPKAKKQPFLEALMEELDNAALQEDGTFLETFKRLNVYAKK